MRICRACVPSPYILRMCSGSRVTSKASVRVHLHAIGQFEGLDARFQLRVFVAGRDGVR